jgi:putative chitinase
MQITKKQLDKAIPLARDSDIEAYHGPLVAAMEHFEINTPRRIAAFLANLAHESGSLRLLEENLNYSAKRLMQVFPRHFRGRNVWAYNHRPEAIANVVYGGRMGNGGERSGDGWKYRGRGFIQLTGKDNYKMLSDELDVDIVNNPDWLLTPDGAAISAAWFWKSRGLNELADKDNLRGITKRINGGLNGHDERVAFYNRISDVLEA